jgi:allantoin racemase
VAAFGDPGLAALRGALTLPVVGIGEAGIAAAARHGQFAVITTTPLLVEAIERMIASTPWGGEFRGVFVTQGDPAPLMADPAGLTEALHALALRAIEAGAASIVVGGGPLAVAARALKPMIAAQIIEPVPEAVAELLRRCRAGPAT